MSREAVLAAMAGVLLVGALLVAIGLRSLFRPARTTWTRVPGVVVAWTGSDVRYPVVEYALPDGTLRRFRNPTTLDLGSYRTGRPVTVLVDPEDPTRAELAGTRTHAVLLGCAFLLLGSTALVVGVAVTALLLL